MSEVKHMNQVLVVEDDKILNDVVCRFVKIAGGKPTSALDGATAITSALENPPSVVLLDLMLPDTSGIEVCKTLKNDDRTRDVPVVVVTALSDEKHRERAMACGADEYITKPFTSEVLLKALKKYVV
jgi:DNA-binding response OmpR family regulator